MDIKRFELNEDRHDGSNVLPREVLHQVSIILEDLKNFTGGYLSNVFDNPKIESSHNEWSCKYKLPLTETYTEDIHKYIEENKEKYNVELEERPFLIFNHGDDKYKIPLNIHMSGSDMIYRNDLGYSVWINTYVAQKI